MRVSKLYAAISAVAVVMAYSASSRADFSYNFDTLTGSPNPGTPLVGSSTVGTVGQDNWIHTSGGQVPVVRNDPITGFSGNYLSSQIATQTSGASDAIETRLGDNLGITSTFATFQFDGLVGPAGYTNAAGVTQYRRSEVYPGVDANGDGKIRPTSLTAENNEAAFQFGFEATGNGWFVRKAAYSTGSVNTATTASGLYRMQLVVDFSANPVNGGFDGAGTLYVKQLADANGNAVNDVFRLAAPTTANVNLGLVAGMGSLGAANPANWNGMHARVANNGAIDNIVFFNGVPTTNSTWAADAGSWLSPANWYIGLPNGIGAEADFTSGARADSTVYADAPVTVGTLKLNNTFAYVIAGAGSLTLQTASGPALVDVQSGNQKINIPLIIASDTNLSVASGATLKISDPVTVNAGKAISQTGAGTVIYESNVNVQSGAAIALGNSTSIHALSLAGTSNAWTGKADVNHTLVLRSGDPAEVMNQIKSGYNGGAWNGTGIASSAAAANASHATALGYASAATLLGLTGSNTTMFDGQVIDGSSIIVKYTLGGDANLDGVVNTTDFNALAANFNGSSKVWLSGDFNYDGQVNALDFNALASHFGAPLPSAPALGALVPEPASLAMLSITGILLRRRRRA